MEKKIVAIDFGTCNTYISQVSTYGIVESVSLNTGFGEDDLTGIQTAVLYHHAGRRKGQCLYGRDAMDEYMGAFPEDREEEGMELALNFKPEITSSKAHKHAVKFLNLLLEAARKAHLQIIPTENNNIEVIIGVPSEASAGHDTEKKGAFCDVLRSIASEAGWGKVRLLDEPFGPLYYSQKDESPSVARDHILNENFLVVDFGGGTCDFTILKDGKVRNSWGDMCLGGRLFDDLFYQWTLEKSRNPDYNEKQHLKDDLVYFFRDIKCRGLKEDFSRYMVRNGTGSPYKKFFEGTRLEMTMEEFLHRAKNYTPSESFRKAYEGVLNINPGTTQFRWNKKIDLLDWFESELYRGFADAGVSVDSIDHVLLAGGSSTWFFVTNILEEKFSNNKIIRSDNVFAAISSGLASYTMIKDKITDIMRGLRVSKGSLISKITSDAIGKLQMNSSKEESQRMLNILGSNLFDQLAKPVLEQFAKQGGKISELETKMKNFVEQNNYKVQQCLASAMRDTITKVNLSTKDICQKWFNEHGLSRVEFHCGDCDIPVFKFDSTNVSPFSFWTQMSEFGLSAIVSSALSAGIVAALLWYFGSVGAIATLLGIGVPVLVAGGIIAILTAVITGTLTLKGAIEQISLPSMLTSWLIDDERIKKLREEFVTAFSKEFPDQYNKFLGKQESNIKQEVEKVVNQELDRYEKIVQMEMQL